MSGHAIKYALRAERTQRLKGDIFGTILTKPISNWAAMLFGTTNGTSTVNVHIVICTKAGNLMSTLSTLKNDMDKASCKSLKDYSDYLKSGQFQSSSK